MALTISPVSAPPQAAGATSAPLQLQPGTVVDARVLQILESGLARIAISGVTLDVASMAPLTVGTNLRLAVSQSGSVTQLAIVAPGEGAPAAVANAMVTGVLSAGSAPASPGTTAATGQLAGHAQSAPTSVETLSVPTPQGLSAPAAKPVSPEIAAKIAVNDAVRAAAPRQDSLAPLFADVAAVASSRALPPVVAAQVEKLLALRPHLDVNLSGKDIQDAFKTSGLFLESSLKAVAQPASAALPPTGDLKAALLVFRQVLSTWSDSLPVSSSPLPASGAPMQTLAAQPPAQAGQANAQPAPAPSIISNVAPNIVINATPQQLQETSAPAKASSSLNTVIVGQTVAGAVDPEMLPILKAALQLPADNPAFNRAMATLPLIDAPLLDDGVVAGGLFTGNGLEKSAAPRDIPVPPSPPLRGAAPSAQQMASPTLSPLAGQAEVAHTLLHETDAALSRQVLHQVGSLPTSMDATNPAITNTGPRWSFEIPFATPQGTAIAQFEIAGEGGRGKDGDRPEQKVWSARFSINVEPAGAIHARIAMANGTDGLSKTSVRLWAERPETAAQLQAGSEQLSHALRQADLDPGSIVIGGGAPDQTGARLSGHFLDRAL